MQLPFALRDPYRIDHYSDPAYADRSAAAPDYLATLEAAAETGLLDLSILQTASYVEALSRAVQSGHRGMDPQGRARPVPRGVGPDHRDGRHRRPARRLSGLGFQPEPVSELRAGVTTLRPALRENGEPTERAEVFHDVVPEQSRGRVASATGGRNKSTQARWRCPVSVLYGILLTVRSVYL